MRPEDIREELYDFIKEWQSNKSLHVEYAIRRLDSIYESIEDIEDEDINFEFTSLIRFIDKISEKVLKAYKEGKIVVKTGSKVDELSDLELDPRDRDVDLNDIQYIASSITEDPDVLN